MRHLTFVLFQYGPNITDCQKPYFYHLLERGSRKSQEKVESVRDRSSTLAVAPSSSSRWRYSPGWALASATVCLQVSWFLALSLHSFIPIFLRSMDTSSSHLILGLPLRLVAYSFPYGIFFGIAVSCILSICPSHLILWHLINLTVFQRQHPREVNVM